MQCPSCEFQNMPGSGRCARCGASLALATAAIDVHPPRAGRYRRRIPQFWGLRRSWANFVAAASRPFASTLSRFDDTNFDLATMLRLAVPGWAHAYRGKRERGIVFFGAYLVFLLPGLILLGTTLGSMLVGLAFGVHVMSAVDVMVGRFSDFAGRAAFSLYAGLGLFFFIYLPTGYLVSRVATPIQITQFVPGFERGDVLWYNRSANVASGDLVYYEVPRTTIAGRTAVGQNANYVFQNGWINRVLAVGGQRLSWQGEQLLVDGVPTVSETRMDLIIPPGETLVVPPGHVLIPPAMLIPEGVQFNAQTWHRLSLVPRSDVYGRLFFRSNPWWRISFLH